MIAALAIGAGLLLLLLFRAGGGMRRTGGRAGEPGADPITPQAPAAAPAPIPTPIDPPFGISHDFGEPPRLSTAPRLSGGESIGDILIDKDGFSWADGGSTNSDGATDIRTPTLRFGGGRLS